MRRRVLLRTLGAAGVGGLAGCSEILEDMSQSDAPAPEVEEYIQCDAQMISTNDVQTDTHTVTVQNTGDSGNIGVALFWKIKEGPSAQPSSVEARYISSAWKREQLKKLYFESDERRSVDFIAAPPDDVIKRFFLAESATYGAQIHNSGGRGQITATIQYSNSRPTRPDPELPTEKSLSIGAETTEEVRFNVVLPDERRWEVEVNPA